MATLTAAADGSHMQGAMIALMPTPGDAERLALNHPDAEPADQLHLTLYFLGDDGAAFGEVERTALIGALTEAAEDYVHGPVTARIFGANHWNAGSDSPSWVWAVGDERGEEGVRGAARLTEAHEAATFAVSYALRGGDVDQDLPDQHSPWVPHICAAYSDDPALLAQMEERLGPVTFDRMRITFGGDATDIPLGGTVTAAADKLLRRQPTDLETRSRVDFAAMDQAWHDAVDETVAEWAAIEEAWRGQIRTAVQAAVTADDLGQLDTFTVDTSAAADLLYARMVKFAEDAGQAQQEEAEEQGVAIPEWSLDDEALTAAAIRDRLRQIAQSTAHVLGVGLVQAAIRRLMRMFGSGQSGREAADAVDEHLRGLSGSAVQDAVGAAMTGAQNAGRMAVLAVAPQATMIATEILDRNSCKPCRDIDGTTYTTLTAAMAAYPSGGYTGCLGGPRCRGTLVTVWDEGATAAGTITPRAGATMREQTADEQGGGVVPYSIVQDHPDCADGEPFAVVKDADGSLQGCHATEAEAAEQVAALYEADGDTPPGDRGDDTDTDMAGQTAPWQGPLAVEGKVTGDGREFAAGALDWADLPVPLRWNKEDSHGGEPHTVAVNVGRIDRIWRDGDLIMGEGVLDLSDEDGRRVHAKIEGKFLRGVSIDADSIADADVEFVWPDDANAGGGDGGEDDLFEMMFAQPEKVIFHGGRIRAATLVDIPAFAEAYIALLDQEGAVVSGGEPLTADELAALRVQEMGAVGTHTTATSDADWDSGLNEKRLDGPLTLAKVRAAYGWYDGAVVQDGEMPKSAAKFLHHEINPDGTVGPANLAACSASIGALHGARGGTTIPDADRRGVYDHVAGHLRDAGQTPEPFRSLPALAASAADQVWRPPAAWFADPKLSVPTGITIDDQGRVYGHAAQWGSCHIGQEDVCVQPPREDDHPYYRTGEVVCDDGTRAAVGQITVGTGHAPLHLGAAPAAEHYDNTGAAVADVAVGNDQHGIWVAGALRPGVDPLRVYELQASGQVSGDWRRIGGQLRLVGLLAVNVPGFPVPKMRARVAGGQQMQALVAAGRPTVAWGRTQADVEADAMRVVMDMLTRRVHAGR